MKAPLRIVLPAILMLTTLGFFVFPGSTYLQQDTQIWAPMIEHLRDNTVLDRDMLARRPHLAYTIYDEATRILSRLAGLPLEYSLRSQQAVARALGMYGVWMLAVAAGLPWLPGLLVAGFYSLGATIAGPAVLTLEYEPTPRAIAGPLLMYSLGLAASQRFLAAGIVCGAAFLYHPPTTAPVLFTYLLLAAWPGGMGSRTSRLRLLLPLAASFVLLLVFARFQAGIREPQELFGQIEPELEELQRFRGAYNWISTWRPQLFQHFEFLGLAAIAAVVRLWSFLGAPLRLMMITLTAAGWAGILLSYVLLEGLKWSLLPQIQPARALAFTVLIAGTGSAAAAIRAVQQRRFGEAFGWFLIVYAIPMQAEILPLLLPDLRSPQAAARWLVLLGCAGLAVIAVHRAGKAGWAGVALIFATLLAPIALNPTVAGVVNYPHLHHEELYELSAWAKSNTPKDSMFLFAGFGKDLDAGIFRARALRNIYVDWKGGGQVNMLRKFAEEWGKRWAATLGEDFAPERIPHFAELGIDYIVLRPAQKPAGYTPAYDNGRYVVYRLR